jgi:hypothetical protein
MMNIFDRTKNYIVYYKLNIKMSEPSDKLNIAKAMIDSDHTYAKCDIETLKVGDYIHRIIKIKEKYILTYIGTIGEIKIEQKYVERWMICGYEDITNFYDCNGNKISDIEFCYKEIIRNMFSYDVKIGDIACNRDGTEVGIVSEVTYDYTRGWAWSDGPILTKMVKIGDGYLEEASNYYIKVI